MDLIVCLVGASGTGKTTVAQELEKMGYNIIQSYTTRPQRYPNEWGHTFIDLTKKDASILREHYGELYGVEWDGNIIRRADMIAKFDKYESMEVYFATYEQYRNKGVSIYIVDPDGARQVMGNVRDAKVRVIELDVGKELREQRLIQRSLRNLGVEPYNGEEETVGEIYQQAKDEAEARLKADDDIFAQKVEGSIVVNAEGTLEETIDIIKEHIEGWNS